MSRVTLRRNNFEIIKRRRSTVSECSTYSGIKSDLSTKGNYGGRLQRISASQNRTPYADKAVGRPRISKPTKLPCHPLHPGKTQPNKKENGKGLKLSIGGSRHRQKSYSDTHSTVYGHVKSDASRMNGGKRGMYLNVTQGGFSQQEGETLAHTRTQKQTQTDRPGHAQTHILQRTSVFKHA